MKEEYADKKKDPNEEQKLVDWENPPKLSDLKTDQIEAQAAHDSHVIDVDTWLDNLNGVQKIKPRLGRSKIVPKLIRKQAEWRYATLSDPFLSTEDLFNVYPKAAQDKESARQNEQVLNYQFNTQIDKVTFINNYVRTGVDEGSIIVKVGWDYEEEIVEVECPVMKAVPVEDPAQAQQMVQQGIPPLEEIQIGVEIQEQCKVITNKPTLDICQYDNVIIDPTCEGDLDRASFIIFSFESSLSELKKDGKYTNLDKIVIETSDVLSSPDYTESDETYFEFKDEPRKKFVVNEYWGYWDIHDEGIVRPFIATWAGDTLIRMEENPFPDQKLPFVLVQYLPVRNAVYGQPDGYLIEDNQKVIGAVTRGMIDILGRSANGQVGIRKDALDVTNARKFEQGKDYKFNANVDPKQAFHVDTFPEIPQSAMLMLNLQNNEAESLTGVKAFSNGISGKSLGVTATGIRSAVDATAKRELDILRRLANGIVKIGKKIISMNSEFLQDEEIIRITDEEFVAISRDNLAGDYDLAVKISTAEADNEKAQELSFMLQTMGNNMDPAMSQMILADIAYLRKMPELADKIKKYQPQPNPLAEQRAQLELQLLQAQIANETAKARENAVDVGLKQAKTATEQAKTRNMHTQADLNDLTFVEQESSVDEANRQAELGMKHKHEKEMKVLDKVLPTNTGSGQSNPPVQ
jgi:hypothetical protein